jgi:hypothetical protein
MRIEFGHRLSAIGFRLSAFGFRPETVMIAVQALQFLKKSSTEPIAERRLP